MAMSGKSLLPMFFLALANLYTRVVVVFLPLIVVCWQGFVIYENSNLHFPANGSQSSILDERLHKLDFENSNGMDININTQ